MLNFFPTHGPHKALGHATEDELKARTTSEHGASRARPRRTTELRSEAAAGDSLTREQRLEVEKLDASPTFTLTEKLFAVVIALVILGVILRAVSHYVFHWPK